MKKLSFLLAAVSFFGLTGSLATAAAGKVGFADADNITLTEDSALTPSAQLSLFRFEGTDGAVTAELAAVPLAGLESPDYPPLRYRLTPADPWTVLPWRGIIPVSFADGVSVFAFEVQAIDNDAWEGISSSTDGGVRCTLTLQNISAPATAGTVPAKQVRLEGNDPRPVMTVTPLFTAEGNTPGKLTPYLLVNLNRAIARRNIAYSKSQAAAGTATNGIDFSIYNAEPERGGALAPYTLPAYTKQFEVPIAVYSDTQTEPDETFTLRLSLTASAFGPGSDTLILNSQALVTILNDDFPPFTIGAASVNEGNAGAATLVFPVSLAAALPGDVSFQWSTLSSAAAGRATTGEDFVAASGTVAIPAGQTAAAITVTVNGDIAPEEDETVLLSLTNAAGGNPVLEASAVGLILDDDTPRIRVGSPRVAEGNPGAMTIMSFPVTLNIVRAVPVSFDYYTTAPSGIASPGIDFVTTSGTVTIPPGSTSAIIDVQVRGDSDVEPDERVGLFLSNSSGAIVPTGPQEGWILNDELPTLRPPSVSNLGETDADYLHNIYFSLSGSLPNTSVDWSIDAPPGSVTPTSGTMNFPLGGSDIAFIVHGDDIPEANAVISITFSNPVNMALPAGGATHQIITLGDDDRLTVAVTGGTVTEGHAGTVELPFTVLLSAALPQNFTFNYSTENGTATAGQDYTIATGTATIPAGATSTIINVTVSGDVQIELDETVSLAISGFSAPSDNGAATPGIIRSDDFPPGPAPQATLVTEASGNGTAQAWFAVDLSAARTVPFSFRVSTRDGTALAGSDYNVLAPANVTFAPGETRKWVAITVTAAPESESQEQFFLDVEALDSHEVKSAACTIDRLAIDSFWRPLPGIYAIRFPTGLGQRYIIEEATSLNGPWISASPILTGSGFPVTQLMFSEYDSGFFHVRSAPPLPPGTPAAGS